MRGGFTLIELLVVISVVSLLIGLLLPALASSRENSRQLKCLTNLKGMSAGILLYLQDESGGMFPNVLIQDQQGDPALLKILADYIDAPVPRRDDDGVRFIVTDPYLCPSDDGDPANGKFEPIWRLNGTSYDYPPGLFMLVAEGMFVPPDRQSFAVTRAYENARSWPFLLDFKTGEGDDAGWHKNRAKGAGPRRNALYFPDWRADWLRPFTSKEIEDFFDDVLKFAGLP